MTASLFAAAVVAAVPVHVVPFGAPPPNLSPTAANGQLPNCSGTCRVQYYGGHVISNVKIYAVLWGAGVSAGIQSGIGDFFTALTNSDWMDWQNEYRTDITAVGGQAGTGQQIGRGTFAGPTITIVPSSPATCAGRSQANPLQDSAIQSELAAQIGAGALPFPDANTLYMIYFPPGCVISSGGGNSCVSGGFCAYHGTLTLGGQSVFYGVVPDFGAGSGCDVGCGHGTTFDNVCSATSHEVGEAMTDAEVGLAIALAPPLAWYDNNNGEDGDMCNQSTATLPSTSYTVQQMYSQKTGLCQVTRFDTNDFKVFMAANTAVLAAGGSVTVPVSTASTSGSPGTLKLALGPLPAGVTGSITASVNPGGTASLTLSASSGVSAVRDAVVVVMACAGTGTCPSPGVAVHSASLLLQISSSTPPANDFSISLVAPAAPVLLPGSTVRYAVSTAVLSGRAETIFLSVTGLPAGVTGTFDVTSVLAGGSATLTLAAAAGSPAPATTFSVKGVSASVPAGHVASGQVQVDGLPVVALVTPSPTISGTAQLTATASSGTGTTLSTLSILIDGSEVASSGSSPLSVSWDTTQVLNGSHMVTGRAVDADGGSASIQANPFVINDFAMTMSPPTAVLTIGGPPVTFSLATSANGAPEQIALSASGLPPGVQASFDHSRVQAGSTATLTLTAATGSSRGHASIVVTATTQSVPAGHQASADVLVVTAPSAAIVSPTSGTLSGTVSISAAGTVDALAGLSHLDVRDGDTLVGTGTTAAVTVSWDTTKVPNGAHALTAVVVDGAGNIATSPVVTLNVANSSGGCSSIHASGVEVLAALALVARLRRRRRR